MIPSFENMEALKADMEKNPDCYVEGTTVYLEDIKEGVRYINGEWVADETMEAKANGDITMSLYEMNRQLINQLPDYNEEAWGGAKEIFNEYLTKHINAYYMLYGRELNYFTVFHKNGDGEFDNLFDALKTCLDSVGTIRSFDFDGEAAIEIWVKPEVASAVTCMYLFPYDDGVVTFSE